MLDRYEGIGVIALGIFLLSFNASVLMVSPSTGTGCVFSDGAISAERLLAFASGGDEGASMSRRCRRVRMVQRWVASNRGRD